jgi:hypothetical protein
MCSGFDGTGLHAMVSRRMCKIIKAAANEQGMQISVDPLPYLELNGSL